MEVAHLGLGDWHWEPTVLLGITALIAAYVIAWRRGLLGAGDDVSPWVGSPRTRVWFFGAGVLIGFIALLSPIDTGGDHYLFSVHMVQHLGLTLVFPPLFLAGIPAWLLRYLLVRRGVRPIAGLLTRPWFAALLFSVTIAVWHLRPFYDLMMRNHDVHIVTHLLFMVTATLMWWPVMSPLPELPRLPPLLAMLYLFLVGLPMQLVGALITFADEVLYPWYLAAPRTAGLSSLDDQQLGGLLMWIPGNLWIFAAIGVVFFSWAREEERGGS